MRQSFLILALFVVQVEAQESRISLTRELLELPSRQRHVPRLSEELRQRMITELRHARTNSPDAVRFGNKLPQLAVDLGDEALIQEFALRTFVHVSGGANPNATRMLFDSGQASVIGFVSTQLNRDESSKPVLVSDQLFSSPSVAAASIMLTVAQKSEAFTPAVREWARHQYTTTVNDEERRALVRVFWAQNSQHFADKNYQAVHPPRSLPSQSPPSARGPSIPAVARPPAKRSSGSTESNIARPQQLISGVAVAPVVSAAPAPLWPWLLLGVGSLGGWLWWRSR